MSQPHLSDDRLIEMCFDPDSASSDRMHLLVCAACESRRATLTDTLEEVSDAITWETDQAFPAERLARQRARILQRVDQDGRLARVIAFPAGHPYDDARVRTRHRARWATVAAAVAASFVVGIFAEHFAHDLPGSRQTIPVTVGTRPAAAPSAAIRASLSDDELLGQVELAASRVGPAALRPLDALTPRPWDVR